MESFIYVEDRQSGSSSALLRRSEDQFMAEHNGFQRHSQELFGDLVTIRTRDSGQQSGLLLQYPRVRKSILGSVGHFVRNPSLELG